jgi:hypothetical protein
MPPPNGMVVQFVLCPLLSFQFVALQPPPSGIVVPVED